MNRLVVASIVVLFTVGCGSSGQKSTETKPAENKAGASPAGQQSAGQQTVARGADQTSQGAQQMAQGMQQMAQGLQQMGKGAATPVDFEQLKTLLPDLSGWTKSDVKGEQVSFGVSQSVAKALYTKGASTIELNITDSALNQLLLAPLTMMMTTGFQEKSEDGFKRAVTMGGFPGFEDWEKTAQHAQSVAVVANRFIVSADAHHVDDVSVATKAVEAVDLSKLASMK